MENIILKKTGRCRINKMVSIMHGERHLLNVDIVAVPFKDKDPNKDGWSIGYNLCFEDRQWRSFDDSPEVSKTEEETLKRIDECLRDIVNHPNLVAEVKAQLEWEKKHGRHEKRPMQELHEVDFL